MPKPKPKPDITPTDYACLYIHFRNHDFETGLDTCHELIDQYNINTSYEFMELYAIFLLYEFQKTNLIKNGSEKK